MFFTKRFHTTRSKPSLLFFDTNSRQLVDGAENLIGNLLGGLTDGLGDVSGGGVPKFDGGPLGELGGVLDKFNITFSGLIDDFLSYFEELTSDILDLDTDRQDLIQLKPPSLPAFSDLLQLGSKKPATQFSPDFKLLLWKKLTTKFTSPFYNGVRIPGLPIGKSLIDEYGSDGVDFPSK